MTQGWKGQVPRRKLGWCPPCQLCPCWSIGEGDPELPKTPVTLARLKGEDPQKYALVGHAFSKLDGEHYAVLVPRGVPESMLRVREEIAPASIFVPGEASQGSLHTQRLVNKSPSHICQAVLKLLIL